ncbi:MAG TPA: DUF2085 domain-containing protein [Pyrinomonadaceae bacterium]|nr:DUF2085 domain-containing protein [Pyrinomonadaceae bacterium]
MSAANQYIPQTGSNARPIAMWLFVVALSVLFVVTIFAAPLALANGHEQIAGAIYQSFRHVCHQLPERSFFIDDHPLAVCARCIGIYLGFAAATVAYPLVKSLRQTHTPHRKWLFIAAALLFIDWSIEFFGIAHNTHSSRFLTGALLGATAVFYVIPGLMELSLRTWGRQRENNPIATPVKSMPANIGPSDYSAPHRRI